jgi:hypothetical protein
MTTLAMSVSMVTTVTTFLWLPTLPRLLMVPRLLLLCEHMEVFCFANIFEPVDTVITPGQLQTLQQEYLL